MKKKAAKAKISTEKKPEKSFLVSLENVGLKINKQQILSNINFSLNKGKITTLIGPNGGGKTSIARILIGVLNPSSGKCILGKKVKIGYMPQKLSIDATIPLRVIDFLHLSSFKEKPTSQEQQKKLFAELRIDEILRKQIKDISGGQLQRVLLARALITEPDLLVLDEPTQFMDIAAQDDFYNLLAKIRRQKNCAILLISHDLHMVMKKTDHVICINHHICCSGSPESVGEHPEYLSLFGGAIKNNIGFYTHHHNHQHQ